MPQLHEPETGAPSSGPSARSRNALLRALPPDEYGRISAHLRTVSLRAKQVFHKQGERITDVYFPGSGAYSLVKSMQDGKVAEIATVGNEGVIGAGVFFGDDLSTGDALVQVPDCEARTMPADRFIHEMERHTAFYDRTLRYAQAFTTQIMQTTVCNGLHSAEQRCCRWLLMTHDRVRNDEFALTHEFLSIMLGVRRPTVTVIAAKLQLAGLIHYRRGLMRIADRPGLEKASCECYETVRGNFARLLPEMPMG